MSAEMFEATITDLIPPLERPGDRSGGRRRVLGGKRAGAAAPRERRTRRRRAVPCRVLPTRLEESVVRLHAGFPGPLAAVSAPSLLTN
jgi:hypothetical protein